MTRQPQPALRLLGLTGGLIMVAVYVTGILSQADNSSLEVMPWAC